MTTVAKAVKLGVDLGKALGPNYKTRKHVTSGASKVLIYCSATGELLPAGEVVLTKTGAKYEGPDEHRTQVEACLPS